MFAVERKPLAVVRGAWREGGPDLYKIDPAALRHQVVAIDATTEPTSHTVTLGYACLRERSKISALRAAAITAGGARDSERRRRACFSYLDTLR